MRALHDRRAKDLLEVLLRSLLPSLQIETEAEIASEAQRADLLVRIDESVSEQVRTVPGLLGRMLVHTCLIEPFSRAPGLSAVNACARKLLTFRHVQPAGSPHMYARMWILASGDPKTARSRWRMKRVRGWPRGVYRAAPATGLWLVVLSRLPRTVETLAVRLLSRGKILREAVADALALPEDDVLRQPLDDMLQRLEIELRTDVPLEEFDLMNQLEAKFQAHVKKCRDEGRDEGRVEGRVEERRLAILDLCELLGIDVTPERRRDVESLDLDGLDALRLHLKAQRAWPSRHA